MNNNALITITGVHGEEGNSDNIEFVTDGNFVSRGSSYQIKYEESEMTGMSGTTTVIDVKKGIVSMTRSGTVESFMCFELGKKQLSYYNTPGGSLAVGINPFEMDISLNKDGGKIHIGYTIEINHLLEGVNNINVNVKVRPKKS